MTEPLNCDQAFERLDDYLDRELSAGETARVRAHLEVCHQCTREFRFEAGVLEGLRAKLRRIRVPAHLVESVSRAIRETRPD